jgi:hypothetical protein
MNLASSPPPAIFSADAADKLEQAIKFMVMTFLSDGLVQRAEVVNILEEVVQMIQRDPGTDASGTLEQ